MYQIIRQHRKTIGISINDELEVIVKAPYHVTKKEILSIIKENENWIDEVKNKKKIALDSRDWIQNKKILYLGEWKKIAIVKTEKSKSCLKCIEDGFIIQVKDLDDAEEIKRLMETYWRKEAYKVLTDLTNHYCKILGYTYGKITLRKQKTRWGSCSSKKNISYNIKLLSAPLEVIEYVVLHEVMHLKYFNHGEEFWHAIEMMMPRYKEHQQYLKKYGMYLGI